MVEFDGLIDKAIEALLRSGGDDLGPLASAYARLSLPLPTIVIDPDPVTLPLPLQRDLLALWRANRDGAAAPPDSLVTPEVLRPFLGRLIVLEPVDDATDFRYRLYGSTVVEFAGFDLTGRLLSETDDVETWADPIRRYYLTTYRAACRCQRPIYAVQRHAGSRNPFTWHRLLLPFVDADGAVSRLVLLTVPCDLDNEPLPSWRTIDD